MAQPAPDIGVAMAAFVEDVRMQMSELKETNTALVNRIKVLEAECKESCSDIERLTNELKLTHSAQSRRDNRMAELARALEDMKTANEESARKLQSTNDQHRSLMGKTPQEQFPQHTALPEKTDPPTVQFASGLMEEDTEETTEFFSPPSFIREMSIMSTSTFCDNEQAQRKPHDRKQLRQSRLALLQSSSMSEPRSQTPQEEQQQQTISSDELYSLSPYVKAAVVHNTAHSPDITNKKRRIVPYEAGSAQCILQRDGQFIKPQLPIRSVGRLSRNHEEVSGVQHAVLTNVDNANASQNDDSSGDDIGSTIVVATKRQKDTTPPLRRVASEASMSSGMSTGQCRTTMDAVLDEFCSDHSIPMEAPDEQVVEAPELPSQASSGSSTAVASPIAETTKGSPAGTKAIQAQSRPQRNRRSELTYPELMEKFGARTGVMQQSLPPSDEQSHDSGISGGLKPYKLREPKNRKTPKRAFGEVDWTKEKD